MPESVIGLDFGGQEAKVAKVENGGVVVLPNELSLRSTPTVLAFPTRNQGVRSAGGSAATHLTSHPDSAVCELRHLLGARHLKAEHAERLREKDKAASNGSFVVKHRGEKVSMRPEQLAAAFLTHLNKKVVEASSQQKGSSRYVLTVPHHFADAERASLLDAAAIAGIDVVGMVNDLTAAALAYGYFQKDLPGPSRKPRTVALVDFGYSSVQAALVEFTSSGLRVVEVQSDRSVGGRDLDRKIAGSFVGEFKRQFPNCRIDGRAEAKMLKAAENVKRLMSASRESIPVSVECFADGVDFHGSMSREEFEALCREEFAKVAACLGRLRRPEDLHSVEVIGGSSRVPMFKSIVRKVFRVAAASTTLNADEAVAKGAALYCASVTRIYRVRPYDVLDVGGVATVLAKHAVVAEEDRDDASSVAMSCVSKTHKIFPANENRTESTVSLKTRPDGDTIAVEYDAPTELEKSLIAVYQLDLEEGFVVNAGEKISLRFGTRNGMVFLNGAMLVSPSGERKIGFRESRVGGVTGPERKRLAEAEREMAKEDEREESRQETKNRFEDETFRFREALDDVRDEYSGEEAWRVSMEYVEGLRGVIYDDEGYEGWPLDRLEKELRDLGEKKGAFDLWRKKYEGYLRRREKGKCERASSS